MQNFQRGDLVNAGWAPTGGVLLILNIRSHTLKLTSLLYDVTNTGSGGVRARLTGPSDYEGTIAASYDLDAPPYLFLGIYHGTQGIATFGVNAAQTRFFQVPVSIESVEYSTAIENELRYQFAVKGNSRAGFLVYPPLGVP